MKERMIILIGYDGSECGDAAIDDLRRAGLPKEAIAIVVSVVENWLLRYGCCSVDGKAHGVRPLGC